VGHSSTLCQDTWLSTISLSFWYPDQGCALPLLLLCPHLIILGLKYLRRKEGCYIFLIFIFDSNGWGIIVIS
jgi:hypothetical protein